MHLFPRTRLGLTPSTLSASPRTGTTAPTPPSTTAPQPSTSSPSGSVPRPLAIPELGGTTSASPPPSPASPRCSPPASQLTTGRLPPSLRLPLIRLTCFAARGASPREGSTRRRAGRRPDEARARRPGRHEPRASTTRGSPTQRAGDHRCRRSDPAASARRQGRVLQPAAEAAGGNETSLRCPIRQVDPCLPRSTRFHNHPHPYTLMRKRKRRCTQRSGRRSSGTSTTKPTWPLTRFSVTEVRQLLLNDPVWRRDQHDQAGDWLAVGETNGGRRLLVVVALDEVRRVIRPITGWEVKR